MKSIEPGGSLGMTDDPTGEDERRLAEVAKRLLSTPPKPKEGKKSKEAERPRRRAPAKEKKPSR
jgi:hypothetical protein